MGSVLKLESPLSNGHTEISEDEAIALCDSVMDKIPIEWGSDIDIISTALVKQGFKKREVKNEI